jgi:hypothetical protein
MKQPYYPSTLSNDLRLNWLNVINLPTSLWGGAPAGFLTVLMKDYLSSQNHNLY